MSAPAAIPRPQQRIGAGAVSNSSQRPGPVRAGSPKHAPSVIGRTGVTTHRGLQQARAAATQCLRNPLCPTGHETGHQSFR